ncbi:hypothetical protein Clacol_007102 [Clathrus columnatus]|uniref:Multidrug resistance-associated ABC transporter n=1 Tax=Clathrus columnatus TaxID=1419009 RepID=A0AAV5AE00_9AGAM|nr:hypothetical protein Clacol_007102 [Clathrus columnatus]
MPGDLQAEETRHKRLAEFIGFLLAIGSWCDIQYSRPSPSLSPDTMHLVPSFIRKLWHPDPAPPGFSENGKVVIPEETASIPSRIIFSWISPLLAVGFSRPLEMEDLWSLQRERLSDSMADRLGEQFYSRCPEHMRPLKWKSTDEGSNEEKLGEPKEDMEADTRSASDESGEIKTDKKSKSKPKAKSKSSNPKPPKSDKDINFRHIFFSALHSTLLWRWWLAGLFKLIGDTLQTTSPLISKALLTWLSDSFAFHNVSAAERASLVASGQITQPRGIGYGIGLAVALFAMQGHLATNQYTILTMTNGMTIRAGVISLIFRKSLRLSGRARMKHSSGQITTLISTDATRLDLASAQVHNLWVNPIQIAIGIGLLIGNLGVSALVGLGVLLIGFPLQSIFVRMMFVQRKKGVKITDQRMRVTTEVLQGIRLIKLYAWEMFYANRIGDLRQRELRTIRIAALARSALISSATAVPIIASILSFIIRLPLVFIPFVFSACADAYVALGRIGEFLTAEELAEAYMIEPNMEEGGTKFGVKVEGDFTWESASAAPNKNAGKSKGGGKSKDKTKESKKSKEKKGAGTDVKEKSNDDKTTTTEKDQPFKLTNLNLRIPRGSFVAIVGRVGSGKSSLLQAMIGEMRKVSGQVTFSSPVSYVPQTPWIMNETLRENILFGKPDDDDEKFDAIVRACSLVQDLKMLPQGDRTEIGEKGINLSGGQKARVSLARAAYSDTDVVLLDDPLSAVDAHVGKAILEQCLLNGPLAGRTRILVTHALHVLKHVDYVYVMDNGVIKEQGTYQDLIANGETFSKLIEEYGTQEEEDSENLDVNVVESKTTEFLTDTPKIKTEASDPKTKVALMQQEERNTGQVEGAIYLKYIKAAGGLSWVPFLVFLLTVTQVASVGNNLFLGFWTSESIPGFRQGDYMAVYAALGVAQGLGSFLTSFAFSLLSLRAGFHLFRMALKGVIRSPISFFDTTPIGKEALERYVSLVRLTVSQGRMLSRLSKDQDTMDTQLVSALYQLLSTFASVLGTIALVFYTFPLLGIIFAPLSILYWGFSAFYRRSSIEAKRLDSVLRSALYASYSETLTGLSTVRAYQEQARFIKTSEHALDVENRAYYMTIAIQRWLGVRLDLLGNILIFGIGLFAVGFRNSVNPSKTGVVLTYSLSITQVLSSMVTLFASAEQSMNSVERVAVYGELEPEGETETKNDPPPSWPSQGAVSFQNVQLAYRPGLPLVLKDVSFDIRPGEKVGIVGRTGAGKSSLLQALLRIVELHQGSIIIDGVNCREIGLDVLRRRLAVIPQDSVLFLGALRDNLDPERSRTDAELMSALRRAWLLPQIGSSDPAAEAKFSLDASVGDEGSNFSAGERQLLALCRALVKNSKIIILDEATSNVDVETDSKLQATIQREFSSSTLLCVAHRLNTIVYYDRVLVMDAGQVAEFDTPLNLYDREDSIFRSLCEEANLSRQDILRIRATVARPEEEKEKEL